MYLCSFVQYEVPATVGEQVNAACIAGEQIRARTASALEQRRMPLPLATCLCCAHVYTGAKYLEVVYLRLEQPGDTRASSGCGRTHSLSDQHQPSPRPSSLRETPVGS